MNEVSPFSFICGSPARGSARVNGAMYNDNERSLEQADRTTERGMRNVLDKRAMQRRAG